MRMNVGPQSLGSIVRPSAGVVGPSLQLGCKLLRCQPLQANRRSNYQEVAFPGQSLGQGFNNDLDRLDQFDSMGQGFNNNASYAPNYGYGAGYGGYNNPAVRYPTQRMPQVDVDDDMLEEEDYYPAEFENYFSEPYSSDKSTPQQRIVNGKQLLINNEIKATTVRVVAGDKGKQQRGVMTLQEALMSAKDLQVDLVLLNPDVQPPLCRLVVWSKYKYEVEKDQKKKSSKAATVETKEVQIRAGTDTNDLKIKLNNAIKFLEKGKKVKISMRLEGRELNFKDQGKQVMLKFVEDLSNVGKVDGAVNFKSSTFTATVSPVARQGQQASSKATEAADAAAENAMAVAKAAAAQVADSNGHQQLPLPPTAPPAGLPLPPVPQAAAAPSAGLPQQLSLPPTAPPAGLPLPPVTQPAAAPQPPSTLPKPPPPAPQPMQMPGSAPAAPRPQFIAPQKPPMQPAGGPAQIRPQQVPGQVPQQMPGQQQLTRPAGAPMPMPSRPGQLPPPPPPQFNRPAMQPPPQPLAPPPRVPASVGAK